MPKKPPPRQKARNSAIGHELISWPFEWECVDSHWGQQAIAHGNCLILSRYLREAKEIHPLVLRDLSDMLNPAANHILQLRAHYRSRGKPQEEWLAKLSRLQQKSRQQEQSTQKAVDFFQICSIRLRIILCASNSDGDRPVNRLHLCFRWLQNAPRSICCSKRAQSSIGCGRIETKN